MKKDNDKFSIQLDILLPYGVAIGAIIGLLLTSSYDNAAYLVYGIILGLLLGVAIGGYLFNKNNKTKKK